MDSSRRYLFEREFIVFQEEVIVSLTKGLAQRIVYCGLNLLKIHKNCKMQNPQTYSKYKLDPFEQVQEIIQSLPYNQHYIKIFPYSHKSHLASNKAKAPHVLIYQQNDELTVQDLIQKYAKETGKIGNTQLMYIFLKEGSLLEKRETLPQIKKKLRIDTLDGVETYFEIIQGFLNECTVQKIYNGKIQVAFTLKDINFPIYLPIQGIDTFITVTEKLSKEIHRIFGKIIQTKIIRLTFRCDNQQRVNEEISFSWLSKEDKVQVSFTNGFKLPAPPRLNNSYLIIKGEEEMNIKANKLHYDDIKDRKVKDVLSQINPNKKWNDYGLKIGDFVLKPEERFSKADSLLRNTTAHFKNVAGVIINESHMFEAEQQSILKICGKVDIQKIVDANQKNRNHRKTCDQKIKIRASNANHPYFQNNLDSIKPILLYTSELYVRPSNNGPIATLYRILNTFLRSQQFGLTTEDHYKQKWEYPFSRELLQQLKYIPPITGKVLWRGIRYETNHKVGERILYKQFSSCSQNEQQAKSFADKGLLKFTKSFSGRSIKDYSYYQVEDQVLFEPYVQFRVTNVTTIQNEQIAGITIPLFELEEVKRTPVPDNKALFLLWVDDKIQEGQKIWGSLKDIHKTTVMKQLLSTQELKTWLQQNSALLKDEAAQFVMITNMTREENKVPNYEAGIHAIKQYRNRISQGHVFVYIFNMQRTIQKLNKHKLDLSPTLQVSDSIKDLRKFLTEVSGLK